MWNTFGVDADEQLQRGDVRWVLRQVFVMLRPYRRGVIGALAMSVLWSLSILSGPYLLKRVVDSAIPQKDADGVTTIALIYIGVAVAGYFVFRLQILFMSQVGENFLRDLRLRVFAHLQRLSMPFYDREKAGVLVSRMTSDVDSLAELVQMGLLMMFMNILVLAFATVFLLLTSWQLFLVVLTVVPFVVVASVKFQRDSNTAYLTIRDSIAGTLTRLQEGISGVRVIQAYARQAHEIQRFQRSNESLYDDHMASVRIQAWYLPVIELAGIGSTALVIGVGGWLAAEDVITLGVVIFYVQVLSFLFEPVQQLSQLFNTIQSSGAGLKKLFELLETPIDVPDHPDAIDLPEGGDLVVAGVSFAYRGGPDVLTGVDLCIHEGEKLALVGPTGAGKSTLAKLVARLYDPTSGQVSFGGVDLRDCTAASLRDRIVVVPQEGFLFNGTIRENIRIARGDASDAEIDQALDDIGVLERFQALADGLDTEVAERGSRLSAGEKQLVSLARAALVDPAVLVLDEATSSLDPGTELLVEQTMDRLMDGRTVVVIAHRLSTAERADRVGVVTGGCLAELGSHADLIARGDRYADLFASWQGGLSSPA